MSVNDTRIIDAVGVEKITNYVVLTIMDQLDWEDEQKHLVLLQDKINTYISFIESGELVEAYPEAKNRKTAISVVGKHKPTPDAIRFFLKVRDIVGLDDIEFRFNQFEELKSKINNGTLEAGREFPS